MNAAELTLRPVGAGLVHTGEARSCRRHGRRLASRSRHSRSAKLDGHFAGLDVELAKGEGQLAQEATDRVRVAETMMGAHGLLVDAHGLLVREFAAKRSVGADVMAEFLTGYLGLRPGPAEVAGALRFLEYEMEAREGMWRRAPSR